MCDVSPARADNNDPRGVTVGVENLVLMGDVLPAYVDHDKRVAACVENLVLIVDVSPARVDNDNPGNVDACAENSVFRDNVSPAFVDQDESGVEECKYTDSCLESQSFDIYNSDAAPVSTDDSDNEDSGNENIEFNVISKEPVKPLTLSEQLAGPASKLL